MKDHKKNIICHIGFPKTGTTFLQYAIFPKIEGVQYIPTELSKQLFSTTIDSDDTVYDEQINRSSLQQLIDPSSTTVLLSNERLTGSHQTGHFVNRSQIARRLKNLGIDKIIITIRNQVDVLESAYRQYIKRGGVLKFKDYFGLEKTTINPPFALDYYNYALIVDLYADLFGKQNVLVLTYETLGDDNFYQRLADFLGVDYTTNSTKMQAQHINKSLGYRRTSVLRILNHFTYSTSRPSSLLGKKMSTRFFYRMLHALPGAQTRRSFMDEETKAYLSTYFRHSNRDLQNRLQVVLNDRYIET